MATTATGTRSRGGVTVQITGDATKILLKLARTRGREREELYGRIKELFRPLSKRAAGHVIKTQLSGRLGPSYQPGVKTVKRRRTGNMARSVEGMMVIEKGVPAIQVGILRGPALAYAGVQEHGTKGLNPNSPYPTIKPKNAKALAMPVSKKITTGTGVARYSGPREFPQPLHAIYFPTAGGKNKNVIGKLVLEKEWRDMVSRAAINGTRPDYASLETIYLLLSKVDIAPGFYLADGVQDFFPTIVAELANLVTEFFED